jgi:hypothetical protein
MRLPWIAILPKKYGASKDWELHAQYYFCSKSENVRMGEILLSIILSGTVITIFLGYIGRQIEFDEMISVEIFLKTRLFSFIIREDP